MALFLVEIRVKDWVLVPEGQSPVLGYEEVDAADEYYARHTGYDQFARRCREEPGFKRVVESRGLSAGDVCAPDAVALN